MSYAFVTRVSWMTEQSDVNPVMKTGLMEQSDVNPASEWADVLCFCYKGKLDDGAKRGQS
jgi:hypothetical protein